MQRRLHAHVHAHAAELPRRAGRHRRHRRQRLARNSRCWRSPARTPSRSATATSFAANVELAPALPPAGAAPGRRRDAAEGRDARRAHHRPRSARFSEGARGALPEDAAGGRQRRRRRRAGAARRSRTERGQGAEARRASPARCAWPASPQVRRSRRLRAGLHRAGAVSKCPVYADHAALQLADFVCGANVRDAHLTGVNWGRDLPEPVAADLRNVVDGDPSPTGTGRAADRARHRGRPHLPARPQVQRGA